MNKLLSSVAFAVALATVGSLAGCELYFNDHHHDSDWNYCGSDGFYQCHGDDCSWTSSTCPSGTDGGSAECGSNTDCSAGCYCDTTQANGGTCEETGFCGSDADCGSGYYCDTARSTCEPTPVAPACTTDTDCSQGAYCDTTNGACISTCTCTGDADAIAGGYGHCDTTRDTCLPGANPAGSCAGTVTCNEIAPTCPSGQVALVTAGCYSGTCEAIAECDAAPSCAAINDDTDCVARPDCSGVYTGIDCTNTAGTSCAAGDSGCTCASFQFASCAARTTPVSRVFVNTKGATVDATSQLAAH